jgi:hypothetical protein
MNRVCPNVRHENITFVVVQMAIEMYSLPVSTANGQSLILRECGSQLIPVLMFHVLQVLVPTKRLLTFM